MNFIICILFLLVQIIINVRCELTSSFVTPLQGNSCGIRTGGPIVQQLTRPLTDISSCFWSDNGNKIAYVERYGPAFGRYTPLDGRFNRMDISTKYGKHAVSIFPVKNGTGLKFVIGMDNSLYLADVKDTGNTLTSTMYSLLTITEDKNEAFLKGKIDNKGRLWYSSSTEGKDPKGRLYKIDNLNVPEVMDDSLAVPSGMSWTEDYKNFYLVDSKLGIVHKYDFDAMKGKLSNKRTVFKLSDFSQYGGHPIDIVLDNEGYLWISLMRSGTVLKFDELAQEVKWELHVPASDLVSLEFGDENKRTLYVGSRKYFNKRPMGCCYKHLSGDGALFAISGTGAQGIPDNEIVIPEKYRNL